MKKRNIVIIATLAILLIIVAVFAYLNARDIGGKKQLAEEESILVKFDGSEIGRVDMDFIKNAGEKEFTAVADTSDSGPEENYYTGVLMRDILEKMGIDIDDYSTFSVKAVDGYTVAFDVEEIRDKDNIYIAYMENGRYLGTGDSGGSGPYQAIVRKDPFSNRWCKFVVEIELGR
jgi:hypothetical protein